MSYPPFKVCIPAVAERNLVWMGRECFDNAWVDTEVEVFLCLGREFVLYEIGSELDAEFAFGAELAFPHPHHPVSFQW